MKVALVFAKIEELYIEEGLKHEHIGLAYIAAQLDKHNINNTIIDGHMFGYDNKKIVDIIVEGEYEVVGFSVLYSNYESSQEIIKEIFKRNTNIKIFMGGQHVSFCAEEVLKENEEVDLVVRGEGEFTVCEVIDAFQGSKKIEEIKGITYKRGNEIIHNKDREPMENIEKYVVPNHGVLEESLKKGQLSSLNFLAGRGCQFNCSFCTGSKIFNPIGKKAWRVKSADNFVDEIREMHERFSGDENLYEVYHFCDLNFINESYNGKIWVDKFNQNMEKLDFNIWFYILTRVDSVVHQKEMVKRLRNNGLVQVEIGLEAGSSNGLKTFEKNITVNQSKEAVAFLRNQNIDINTSGFIMYHPYSTLDELKENANFLLEINYWKILHLFTKMALYPGSDITSKVKASGLLNRTYKHNKVYDYHFENAKVEVLFNNINENLDFHMLNTICNKIIFYEMELTLTYRKIEKIVLDVNELKKSIEMIEKDIRESIKASKNLIYNFFIECIENAQIGWDAQRFDFAKNIFTRKYMLQGDEVREKYLEYSENILKFVDAL